MKLTVILGVILILAGALGLYFRGVPYTKKEEVFKVGSMKAQVETKETYEVHPAISGIVLAGGVALLVFGLKKKH